MPNARPARIAMKIDSHPVARFGDRAEHVEERRVGDGDDDHAGRGSEDDARRDLAGRERRRAEAEEVAAPFEAGHDRVAELLARDGDRRGHQQRRRDEDEVRHLDAALGDRRVDQRGQADGEAEQVEDRLPERADDDGPAVRAHRAHHVLGDVPGAEGPRLAAPLEGLGAQLVERGLGDDPIGRRELAARHPFRVAHSISDLPVRRRNTSSRLERRTSEVIGSSPRSVTRSRACSPFSV